jgi:hypothetical protein
VRGEKGRVVNSTVFKTRVRLLRLPSEAFVRLGQRKD